MTFTNTSSNEIKVNPEYYKIVNPLSNIEYESLNKSIKVDGLHYPIVINSKESRFRCDIIDTKYIKN
jgi:hypothetical protein